MKLYVRSFFFLFLLAGNVLAQQVYFPDAEWQTKKPGEVKMNAALIDSAVQFAIRNETRTDYDLRIANMKSYSREPGIPGK